MVCVCAGEVCEWVSAPPVEFPSAAVAGALMYVESSDVSRVQSVGMVALVPVHTRIIPLGTAAIDFFNFEEFVMIFWRHYFSFSYSFFF